MESTPPNLCACLPLINAAVTAQMKQFGNHILANLAGNFRCETKKNAVVTPTVNPATSAVDCRADIRCQPHGRGKP
jgi:hypothetical protein